MLIYGIYRAETRIRTDRLGRDELSDRRDRQPARVLVQGDRDGAFGGDRAARAGGAGGRDRLRVGAPTRALPLAPARGPRPGRDPPPPPPAGAPPAARPPRVHLPYP